MTGSCSRPTDMLSEMLLLSLAFLCFVSARNFHCGPNLKCSCTDFGNARLLMNCSNRNVQLCEVCAHASNVTDIDVSSNEMTKIATECIANCHELVTLNAANNNIRQIEGNSTISMESLKELDLSANRLCSLYTVRNNTLHMFQSFPNLSILKINGNFGNNDNLKTSYPNLSVLQKLETLFIDGLHDTDLDISYSTLHALQTIVMSGFLGHCSLGDLQNSTFQSICNTVTLNISNCQVTNIAAGTFEQLHLLKTLDISNNPLGFAPFRNLSYGLQYTNIKSLNYSKVYRSFGTSTIIRKQDICYLRNTTLQEIKLDSNRLSFFQPNAMQLFPESLELLYIRNNKLSFGGYVFQFRCLETLQELHVDETNKECDPVMYFKERYNESSATDNYVNDCPFMQETILRNISLKQKCKFIKSKLSFQFPELPKKLKKISMQYSNLRFRINRIQFDFSDNDIESLDFSRNTLYSWLGPLSFPKLMHLDLSDNRCSSVSSTFFSSMTNLRTLNLKKNLLGLVTMRAHSVFWFESLQNLRYLDLSTNAIRQFQPKIFDGLSNLEKLDLSSNRLVEMAADMTSLKNLKYLNLRDNFLFTLPMELLSALKACFPHLKDHSLIDLSGNLLQCTCKNKDFVLWVTEYKQYFTKFDNYTFVDEYGHPLHSQDVIDFVQNVNKQCGSFTVLITLCCIGLSVYISVVIGGIAYRYRWKLRYFFYLTKHRLKGHTETISNRRYRYDAFISYAEENNGFIREVVSTLEERGLSLCVHQRDFIAGSPIVDNIVDAIQNSRKTVVMLSRAFLRQKWCMYEFQMARMESIYSREGDGCLLVVMLEETPVTNMQLEMLQWIQTGSYLEYTGDMEGETMFWEKLEDAIRR